VANYTDLLWEESSDLGDTLAELSEADWDAASLCEGWRVRDVVSHMLTGHTYPVRAFLGPGLSAGLNVDKAASAMAIDYGSAHTPAEILAAWQGVVANRTTKGISKAIPRKEGFVDHLVHHQDIRRPLGKPRQIPEPRLRAALDLAVSLGGMVKPKKKAQGLKLVATDLDWSHGEGLEVRGPGEAIVLALYGRSAALADLEGEGLDTLGARLR
jgi:uncharacterized protein (TIGR03083 family)